MTDTQAALGISQMKRLDVFVANRNEIVRRYHELLSELPVRRPELIEEVYSSWHLYLVRLQLDRVKKTHREVFEDLREAGIGVNLHYMPVHLQPYYRVLGFGEGMFPGAESYGQDAISLPMHPKLTCDHQESVIKALTMSLET